MNESPDPSAKPRYWVPSQKLREIRDIFARSPELSNALGAPLAVRLVVDSSSVIADIRWLVRHGKSLSDRTALLEIADAGTAELAVPTELIGEVEKHLPIAAAELDVDLGKINAIWEGYRTRLRLLKVPQELLAGYANSVDPKDAPFVLLQKLISASGVVSRDRHIKAMGGTAIGLDVVMSLRGYSRSAAVQLHIKVAGVALGAMGFVAIRSLFALLGGLLNAIAKAPPAVKIVLLLGVLFAVLHEPTRNKLEKLIEDMKASFREFGPVVANKISELVVEANLQSKLAQEFREKVEPVLLPNMQEKEKETSGAPPPVRRKRSNRRRRAVAHRVRRKPLR